MLKNLEKLKSTWREATLTPLYHLFKHMMKRSFHRNFIIITTVASIADDKIICKLEKAARSLSDKILCNLIRCNTHFIQCTFYIKVFLPQF